MNPNDLMNLFDSFDDDESTIRAREIIHAPFGYPGGKSRSFKKILEQLPQRDSYIEVFGGSGIVLLNRKISRLEVYNDRYGGIVAFYRCVRDPELIEKLVERLKFTCYSKEEFYWCLETWNDVQDQVERAARWYYMVQSSFAKKGEIWGRVVSPETIQGRVIQNNLGKFLLVHERLKWVQMENQDWSQCISDYDNSDAVFYLDPPYLNTNTVGYEHEMSVGDHERMVNRIMDMKGFVALSGYDNELYNRFEWADKIEWEVFVSIGKSDSKNEALAAQRKSSETEVLWIKEAR